MTTNEVPTMKIVILYKNGKPNGFMSVKRFMNMTCRQWWDTTKFILIPTEHYNNERVHIGNVQRYVDMYDDNPMYYKFIQ